MATHPAQPPTRLFSFEVVFVRPPTCSWPIPCASKSAQAALAIVALDQGLISNRATKQQRLARISATTRIVFLELSERAQAWARVEGDLHRSIVSYALDRARRNKHAKCPALSIEQSACQVMPHAGTQTWRGSRCSFKSSERTLSANYWGGGGALSLNRKH